MSVTEQPFHTIEISDPRFESEGLRTVTVKSRSLGRRADITVFVPRQTQKIPTLMLLLHGVYGSHWSWAQKTGVHRIAQRMIDDGEIGPVVLAMPSDGLWGDGSGYLPHQGHDAEKWIVEEVVQAAKLAAPGLNSGPRQFIAGLSMGGYGALRLGAKYSKQFEGISAHSSITRVNDMSSFAEEPLELYIQAGQENDLDPLFWMKQHRSTLPRLRFDCGASDALAAGNRELHAALEAEGIAHVYEEFEGGHEWAYWEKNVPRTLRFIDEAKNSHV